MQKNPKKVKLNDIDKDKWFSNDNCVVIFWDRIVDFRAQDAKLDLKVLDCRVVVVQDKKAFTWWEPKDYFGCKIYTIW
jgi:hypothetical protein